MTNAYIDYTQPTTSAPPPMGEDSEEFRPEEAPEKIRIAREGKVPLSAAAVIFPASVSGRLAAELTGYPGWMFTEYELQKLGELWEQCGVEVNPVIQAMAATVGVIGAKGFGYAAWSRAGKPGDLKAKAMEETKPVGGD